MNTQEIEELMKPRYKVIADWPGNVWAIGEIVDGRYSHPNWFKTCEKYPHLFKPLQWWEERDISEMPEYVKYQDISLYFPVDRVCKGSQAPFESHIFEAINFLPATLTEYTTYTQSQNNSKNVGV